MSKLEIRTFETEIRADKDSNTVTGYASVFNTKSKNLGGFVEKVSPTAFDSSLASKQDVMARFNHSDNHLLGRTGSGSLKLTKDENGLRYDLDLPDTSYARDLKSLMQRGDVNKSSFAFRCNKDSWGTDPETGLDLRTLDDVDLVDIAPVVNPAYDSSSSGLRSVLASAPAEVRSRIEARMATSQKCDCDCEACSLGDCTRCDNDDCDDDFCTDCGSALSDDDNLPGDDGLGDTEANSAKDDSETDDQKKYIQFKKGNKDSKGDLAEWVVLQKGTGKILASLPTKEKAMEHYNQMVKAKYSENSDKALSEFRKRAATMRAAIMKDLLK